MWSWGWHWEVAKQSLGCLESGVLQGRFSTQVRWRPTAAIDRHNRQAPGLTRRAANRPAARNRMFHQLLISPQQQQLHIDDLWLTSRWPASSRGDGEASPLHQPPHPVLLRPWINANGGDHFSRSSPIAVHVAGRIALTGRAWFVLPWRCKPLA